MLDQFPLTIAPRYTRAIHIQRDFHDLHHGLDGYQVTPLVQQTARRIIDGLAPENTERAFSIVGPFGSGKSAFGLFIAHFLQRSVTARRQLLGSLNATPRGYPAESLLTLELPSLLAVRIPGNNSSLRYAILSNLRLALSDARVKTPKLHALQGKLESALQDPEIDPARVAELVAQVAQYLREEGHFAGVLVVIDELGQYLDYAARQDEERDLFVLQSLAEMAARSGETPVLIVTILHQAFERYTLHASSTRRVEWAKVQGRFVDLTFQEPSIQSGSYNY